MEALKKAAHVSYLIENPWTFLALHFFFLYLLHPSLLSSPAPCFIPSLPPCFTYWPPPSPVTLSQPYSFSPTLIPSLPPSIPPSLPAILDPSLPTSLLPSLPLSSKSPSPLLSHLLSIFPKSTLQTSPLLIPFLPLPCQFDIFLDSFLCSLLGRSQYVSYLLFVMWCSSYFFVFWLF